jgi:hypothetical protein
MSAEDRRDNPSRSSRPRKGGFDPGLSLTEALKDLVSKHRACFHPAIIELTWDLLNSSWQPGQVRSGQVRYFTRPKCRTMRLGVTMQRMLPPSTVT